MRFSLRSLLLWTALVAVICGVFALPRGWPVVAVLPLSLTFLAAAATGAAFGADDLRAFCLGYLVAGFWIVVYVGVFIPITLIDSPARLGEILDSPNDQYLTIWKATFAGYFATNLLCGLAGVGIRRFCLRRIGNRINAGDSG